MPIFQIKDKKIKILIILALLVVALGGLFFISESRKREEVLINEVKEEEIATESGEEIEELEFSQEELEKYYAVYDNSFVLYLRKCLNAYLANDSSGVNIAMAAVQKDRREGIISGLDSFDKEYYKSKFIVVTIDDSIAGGKDIQIMFQDKQDRIFYAWVYRLASEEEDYELRGFNSKEFFDEEKMAVIRKLYGKYLNDPEHAL